MSYQVGGVSGRDQEKKEKRRKERERRRSSEEEEDRENRKSPLDSMDPSEIPAPHNPTYLPQDRLLQQK